MKSLLFTAALLITLTNCSNQADKAPAEESADHSKNVQHNYISDFSPYSKDSLINVVIEIPAGTNAKWEVEKTEGRLEHQLKSGSPRIINYLPYPANYGMIPRSILPKELGGDGDPLDVIVLGPTVERGQVIPAKLIGVLRLLDRGEIDDKLIAISKESPLSGVNNLKELEESYPGVKQIIETWFTHYKGPDMVVSEGYRSRGAAIQILNNAIDAYHSK